MLPWKPSLCLLDISLLHSGSFQWQVIVLHFQQYRSFEQSHRTPFSWKVQPILRGLCARRSRCLVICYMPFGFRDRAPKLLTVQQSSSIAPLHEFLSIFAETTLSSNIWHWRKLYFSFSWKSVAPQILRQLENPAICTIAFWTKNRPNWRSSLETPNLLYKLDHNHKITQRKVSKLAPRVGIRNTIEIWSTSGLIRVSITDWCTEEIRKSMTSFKSWRKT